MDPRNEEASPPTTPTQAQETEGRKPRFQVIKVEDNIAQGQDDEMRPTRGRGCRCRCGR